MPKRTNDLLEKLPTPGSKPAIEIESLTVAGDKVFRFTDYRAFAAFDRFSDTYEGLSLDRTRPALISSSKKDLSEIRARVREWPVHILDPERARYAGDELKGIPYVERHRFGSTGPMVRIYVAPDPVTYTTLSASIDKRFAATPTEIDYVRTKIARGAIDDTRCRELFDYSLADLEQRIAEGQITKPMLDKIDALDRKANEPLLDDIRELHRKGQLTKLNCGIAPDDHDAIDSLSAHDAYRLRRLGNQMATAAERATLLAYAESGLANVREEELDEIRAETLKKRDFTAITMFRAIGQSFGESDEVGETNPEEELSTDHAAAFEQLARSGFYDQPRNQSERDHNALARLEQQIARVAAQHHDAEAARLFAQAKERGESLDDPTVRKRVDREAMMSVEHLRLPVTRRHILKVESADSPYVFATDAERNGYVLNVRDAMVDPYTRASLFSEDGVYPFLRIERPTSAGKKSFAGALHEHSFAAASIEAEAIATLHQHRWSTNLQTGEIRVGELKTGEVVARNERYSALYDGDRTIAIVANSRLPEEIALFEQATVKQAAPQAQERQLSGGRR